MEDELDAILSQLDCEQLLSLDADFAIDPTYSRACSKYRKVLFQRTPKRTPHGQSTYGRLGVLNVGKPTLPFPIGQCIPLLPPIPSWTTGSAILLLKQGRALETNIHLTPCYAICCGLMRYIREQRPNINFFADPEFATFRKTLDGEMKRLRSLGLGVKKKQAEPITVDDETLPWDKGQLGDHSPHDLPDWHSFCLEKWSRTSKPTDHTVRSSSSY